MDPNASYGRRLLHRWLIQYNPLYLLSAMLVLGGMFLWSRGMAHASTALEEVGVAAIAELYALTLIGGAALLTRIGQRRPAVMLALLTALYQWDLTLHTETSANLGAIGTAASIAWLVLFVVKLHALAWAMKLRLSRAASASAIVAGIGLAAMPHLLARLDRPLATGLVVVWLFVLFSIHRADPVTSLVSLDGWGRTVLRRGIGAVWALSGLLVAGHVLFWSTHAPIALHAIVILVPLLALRKIESEARAWAVVAGMLGIIALAVPAAFAGVAFLTTIALVLRTLPRSEMSVPPPEVAVEQPYRASFANVTPEDLPAPSLIMVARPHAERMRLFAGALFTLYLALWTASWNGGPWPAHDLALDLGMTLAACFVIWRAKVRLAGVPLALSWVHCAVSLGLVPMPQSLVAWGTSAVVLGFVILIASIAASYRFRRLIEGAPPGELPSVHRE